MATFKRVISNPDEIGRYNAKMSKNSSHSEIENDNDDGILTPAMDTLAIMDSEQIVEEETDVATSGDIDTPSTPIDSNRHDAAVNETTDIKDTSGNATLIDNDNTEAEPEKPGSIDKRKEVDETAADGFTRQVSVDSSTPNTKAPPKIVEVTHISSSSLSIRNKSESTIGSSAANTAKDWGWFEDIHEGKDRSPSYDKKGYKKTGGLIPFNELVNPLHDLEPKKGSDKRDTYDDGTLMAVTAPTYVLEESISTQRLWKSTAGTRPPQPVEERLFYEKLWAQNFKRSQVDYKIPTDVLTATSPISLSPFADGNFGEVDESLQCPDDYSNAESTGYPSDNAAVSSTVGKSAGPAGFYTSSTRSKTRQDALLGPHNHHHTLVNKKVKDDGTDDELTVLVRGDNVFGTTVSKSFPKDSNNGIDTVSISVASYRVVESKKHGKYAQFLVIFCEGTFRDTIGVWKRYSDFEKLSHIVSHGHESCTSVLAGIHPLSVTEDPHQEMLPNAITSWNLLRKRKRWYRCLDAGYLSLKAFLLERFLHDILFESSTPQILRDFVNLSFS